MTTYSKRRGRRSLAAILAAMLIASVLAVVAGSPAQAANTASQVLIDHDGNAKTDKVREFAGQDRYDTALRLAKNFATSKGGLGAVPAVFIASGESLVDSISVAGLAGYVDAPILLTPTGSLHGGVKDFIEDYDVKTVYVLGGSAAVSDASVTAIEGLTAKPTVTRIAGDDRYATAAAIASMIEADSSWCGTEEISAVLINGSSDALPFGVAVGTTAYKLQLPVLMTAADELPDATAEYISDNDVEHVQIVGNTDTVSADVAAALTTLGVDTVARVEGDSAAAVSVELANMANNGCGDDLAPVSTDRVVLVRGNPDGVAAAPVLASSLANGELVTPLIVGDTLPASVSDYLAATPKVVNGTKLALGIVAVGGTAAVSEAVMDAAIAAATSAGDLTVSIAANTDTNKDQKQDATDPVFASAVGATETVFALYFSDDVPDAGTDTTADPYTDLLDKIRDIVEVNGVAARVTAVSTTSAGGSCLDRRVDVTIAQTVSAGDKISIAGSTLEFGTQDDERTVAPASTTVQAVPKDTAKPRATIVGIAGESGFQIQISDAGGLPADATIDAEELTFVSGKGNAAIGTIAAPTITAGDKSAVWTVPVAPAAENGRTETGVVAGDRLTLKSGAVMDRSENVNAASTGRAIAAQKTPKISEVLLSTPVHAAQNSWTAPATFGAAFADTGAAELTITAKASGDAAGAAGNAWRILFDVASTRMDSKPLDIDVRVDAKGRQVSIRHVNGKATLGDLLAALRANSDFDQRFSVSTDPCSASPTTPLVPSAAARNTAATSADSGRTQFAIEVRFRDFIKQHTDADLLDDVLARTVARSRVADRATLITALTTAGSSDLGGETPGTGSPAQSTDRAVYGKTVRYEMTASSAAHIPRQRDIVDTAAGSNATDAAAGYEAPSTPVDPVATGYAADDAATTKVREDYNAKSQVFINLTSRIKARNN